MKKSAVLFLTALSTLIAVRSVNANVIATWTFETSPPADLNNSATISGILADIGTGTASGVHASAATDWSTPGGNGSANSLSATDWAIADYFQFSTLTTGYENIFVRWAQTSSATGPGEFKLAYQVNGGGFTDFLNYTVLPNQAAAPGVGVWSSVTENTGYNFLVDLSAVTGLDNAAAVDFRLIMRTTADSTPPGTVATTGTDRVDNFSVTGNVRSAPEQTSTLALAAIGVFGCFAFGRRVHRLA